MRGNNTDILGIWFHLIEVEGSVKIGVSRHAYKVV